MEAIPEEITKKNSQRFPLGSRNQDWKDGEAGNYSSLEAFRNHLAFSDYVRVLYC